MHCVLNNQTKERLLPIVKEYKQTNLEDDEEEAFSIRNRLYLD